MKTAMMLVIALGIILTPGVAIAEHIGGQGVPLGMRPTILWADTSYDDAYGGTDVIDGQSFTMPNGFFSLPIRHVAVEPDQAYVHHDITFPAGGNYVIGGDAWINGMYGVGTPMVGVGVELWRNDNLNDVIGDTGDYLAGWTTVQPGGWYELPVTWLAGQAPLAVVVLTGPPMSSWHSYAGYLEYH
jgi:hypothetical protein